MKTVTRRRASCIRMTQMLTMTLQKVLAGVLAWSLSGSPRRLSRSEQQPSTASVFKDLLPCCLIFLPTGGTRRNQGRRGKQARQAAEGSRRPTRNRTKACAAACLKPWYIALLCDPPALIQPPTRHRTRLILTVFPPVCPACPMLPIMVCPAGTQLCRGAGGAGAQGRELKEPGTRPPGTSWLHALNSFAPVPVSSCPCCITSHRCTGC